MSFLDISNVTKEFVGNIEECKILVNITFSIKKGDFLCIVGPSGCGKTTLLRMMAGFEMPTQGTVTCNGEEVKRPGMKRAFIFQEHDQLLPWNTAKQNVVYPMRLSGNSKKEYEARFKEYFSMVGLRAEDAGKYPHQLSGGMKQRVAIARALAMQPEILFMDEPFSSVDAFTKDKLHESILTLWQTLNLTIVFVTHSIDEAIRLSSRIIVLGGKPSQVIGDYLNNVRGQRRPTDGGYTEIWKTIYAHMGE